ncbi:MAG TPA: MarR family winged helix-turn-helix transcriptional regulator [Candidatus Deferrimicrobium sp.]|nr:MarR family winged helix-turn-helix transcriptional regulator [Candidatus Deferrimicrobium sp.]
MTAATTPTVPWLTEAEQRTWRSFGRAARLLFAQLDRDLSRDAGMAPGAYEILVVLSEAPQRALRMNELAEATLSSPSRISHAVERLVDVGWVERATCPSDRRGWLAILTDAGYDALAAAAPRHVEHIRTHLFDGLSDSDVADLGRISEAILTRLPASASLAGGCTGD